MVDAVRYRSVLGIDSCLVIVYLNCTRIFNQYFDFICVQRRYCDEQIPTNIHENRPRVYNKRLNMIHLHFNAV